MTEIHAPYNFVPVAHWVYFPSWSRLASHDVPFSDGIDGTLEFTVTAKSPLLVAAEQAGQDKHFVQAPDDRYFIPGSELRGLIRNVLEIASFGKLALVDDRHLGVRDLTGGLPAYTDAMTHSSGGVFTPKTKAGWLNFINGQWWITPCEHSRVDYRDMVKLLAEPNKQTVYRGFVEKPLDDEHRTARAKYDKWAELGGPLDVNFDSETPQNHTHSPDRRGNPKILRYSAARNLGTGATPGRLVLTGQPSPSGQPGRKHMEFIFHGRKTPALRVEPAVMRGFLQVHADSADWNEWRRLQRNSGEEIPVFYLESAPNRISSLGLAQMYKLPYRLSVREALANSSPDHASDVPDFAETLFGRAGDDVDAPGLRSRVSFDHAFCVETNPLLAEPVTVILNGPKPSYYPNYIRQHTDETGTRLATNTRGYSTLMDTEAQLRGWKRYPSKPFRKPPSVPPNNITATLHPLREGTRFTGRLRFHNLKPQELGGLLWALIWGERENRFHSLGMGKPFDYGQSAIRLDPAKAVLRLNDGTSGEIEAILKRCLQSFITEMERVYAERSGDTGGWENSPQIHALLAMADPAEGRNQRLDYMVLDHRAKRNDFTLAKKKENSLVLADYVPYTPPPVSGGAAPSGGSGRQSVLDGLLSEVMKTNNIVKKEDAFRGQPLAKAWAALDEGEDKVAVKAEILAFWKEQGWWDSPPGPGAKKAKAIYEGGPS
jgi:CRISPR-associated protein (TIGR03986 family)